MFVTGKECSKLIFVFFYTTSRSCCCLFFLVQTILMIVILTISNELFSCPFFGSTNLLIQNIATT